MLLQRDLVQNCDFHATAVKLFSRVEIQECADSFNNSHQSGECNFLLVDVDRTACVVSQSVFKQHQILDLCASFRTTNFKLEEDAQNIGPLCFHGGAG